MDTQGRHLRWWCMCLLPHMEIQSGVICMKVYHHWCHDAQTDPAIPVLRPSSLEEHQHARELSNLRKMGTSACICTNTHLHPVWKPLLCGLIFCIVRDTVAMGCYSLPWIRTIGNWNEASLPKWQVQSGMKGFDCQIGPTGHTNLQLTQTQHILKPRVVILYIPRQATCQWIQNTAMHRAITTRQ